MIVKGSSQANIYRYDPEATSDTGLYAPDNASGGPAGLSHIDFCFDYELQVTKTATTSLTRTFAWTIAKTADAASLLLSLGQEYLVGYHVTVSSTSADSAWATAGTIDVWNPAPVAATVTSVTDALAGVGDLPVDCGGATFPLTLAPGATLACTYAAPLPDATTRLNTATATATGSVGSGTGTATVDFATAAVTTVDDSVDVSDTLAGSLGTVTGPKTFDYSLYVGGYDVCGPHQVDNTATFTAASGATGSATASVAIDVPCEGGCSLTQGYWKTHSSFGPAPYDDVWAGLENSPFFLSGKTYYQVLWTSPQGNAYYNLAHQYIAAVLNGANGASTDAVQTALGDATALLSTYTPLQVAMLKKSSTVRAQFVQLASILDQYNSGAIGPGHCSE